MRKSRMRGFSLIEMIVVIAILITVLTYAVLQLQAPLKATRVTNAYNTTLGAMRQARDISISQRQTYYLTFSNAAIPNTITVTQGSTGTVINTFQLPNDVTFLAQTGLPSPGPDSFGAGGTAIDFDQGVSAGNKSVIYFYPDGTAQDVNGNVNNGVIYISRNGDLFSTHAITVWGSTGRLRGWRLYTYSGSKYWRQM